MQHKGLAIVSDEAADSLSRPLLFEGQNHLLKCFRRSRDGVISSLDK
jgi:hypothetical protein